MSIRPASSRPPQAPGAKIDFNALRAPANYVPGLGRGAAGFTTRSDIGPSMPAPDMASQGGDDDSKFDEFLGNDGGVLAGTGAYDDEDREADAVWDQVEDRMDERRREHRDARMKEELERFRAANPRIGDLFTDLKRGLAELDASAWEAIPEIGDTTVKRARRAEIFTPVPDSLLALAAFPGKKSVWRRAAALEKLHGTPEQLDALLRRAVQYCPQAEVLWLMAAKERWRGGDVGGARAVLEEAFLRNPDSEEIWLAAFKVEFESRELDRARMILARAREHPPASTQRVWMKSAIVEREAGDAVAEAALLEEGLTRFPTAWKLHLMAGALAERQGEVERARAAYHAGIKRCLDCVPLWIAAAALEEREGALARARALLEQARLKNPGQPALWLAAARTEARAGNGKAAEALLARALQACPDSGAVWAESIRAAPRPARRSRSVDALKRCNDDPTVVAAVAQLFWGERKVEKARSWFDRAVTLDPDVGDHWALYLRFEAAHGTPEAAAAVLERAVAAEPRHGERWQALAKDPVNAHQPLGTLLKKLAQTIEKDMAM
ncbi:PRP6 [Auxenochlorella protothecoides x Auxenochlorella symbiontica]